MHKIKPEVDKGIQEVIDNAAFIQGNAVTDFAQALSGYLGFIMLSPVPTELMPFRSQ